MTKNWEERGAVYWKKGRIILNNFSNWGSDGTVNSVLGSRPELESLRILPLQAWIFQSPSRGVRVPTCCPEVHLNSRWSVQLIKKWVPGSTISQNKIVSLKILCLHHDKLRPTTRGLKIAYQLYRPECSLPNLGRSGRLRTGGWSHQWPMLHLSVLSKTLAVNWLGLPCYMLSHHGYKVLSVPVQKDSYSEAH